MDDIKTKIEKYIQNQEYAKAVEVLTGLINRDLNKVDWLILRGNIYNIKQEYSKSLNDHNKALKIDSKNKIIPSKVEMIKDILKFQALDIFASTNLNMDPWLDN